MVKLWHEEMINTKLTELNCPLGTTQTLHKQTEEYQARQPTNKKEERKSPNPRPSYRMAVCESP